MMQSAPINRAAVTVFSRCCATTVSTVGTPVISMMATLELVFTMLCKQDLHHHLGARAVEGADDWQGENSVPELHYGGGKLQHLFLLPLDDPFARFLVHLGGVQAHGVK